MKFARRALAASAALGFVACATEKVYPPVAPLIARAEFARACEATTDADSSFTTAARRAELNALRVAVRNTLGASLQLRPRAPDDVNRELKAVLLTADDVVVSVRLDTPGLRPNRVRLDLGARYDGALWRPRTPYDDRSVATAVRKLFGRPQSQLQAQPAPRQQHVSMSIEQSFDLRTTPCAYATAATTSCEIALVRAQPTLGPDALIVRLGVTFEDGSCTVVDTVELPLPNAPTLAEAITAFASGRMVNMVDP